MKILSLFAVALLATTALLSSGCSEPSSAPEPTTPAADSSADMDKAPAADAGGSGEKADMKKADMEEAGSGGK